MSRKDLEKQVRELSNELTMATFISRGAISENRELKSELEELRKQNAILRTTEARLTTTEEQLEICQERVNRKEARVRELERLTASLQGSLKEWELVQQDMRGWMKQGQALLDREMVVERSVQAGSSTPGRRSRSRQIVETEPELRQKESRTPLASAALVSELFPDVDYPRSTKVVRPSTPVGKKKRRRIGEEDEEETDEPYNPPRSVVTAAAVTDARSRSPLRREKKKAPIQLATIKIERPESDIEEGSDGEYCTNLPLRGRLMR